MRRSYRQSHCATGLLASGTVCSGLVQIQKGDQTGLSAVGRSWTRQFLEHGPLYAADLRQLGRSVCRHPAAACAKSTSDVAGEVTELRPDST